MRNDMIQLFQKITRQSSFAAHTLAALFVLVATWAWQARHIWATVFAGGGMAFADSGIPMLLSVDGYYYLERASASLRAESLTGIPPLSALTALAHQATGLPLEAVALLWGPLTLIPLSVLCAALSRRVQGPVYATGLMALVLTLIPAWAGRTHFAWFDTDAGVALLWHACFLSAARWSECEGRTVRLQYCAFTLGLCLLFTWWWRPGIIALPLCLLLWAAMVKNRNALLLRCVIGLGIPVGICALALAPDAWLPQFLNELRAYGAAHARLVLGLHDALIYRSIAELGANSVETFLTALGGGWPGGLLILLSLGLLCATRPRESIVFIPSILMLLLGVRAERFLFIAAPVLACAVAMLPESLERAHHAWKRRRRNGATHKTGTSSVTRAAGFALVCAAIVNMLVWQAAWQPRPLFRGPHDTMALAVRKAAGTAAGEHVALWNWWDDGYFLAARTGLRPLFDGGSQTPGMAYIAARPLISDDDVFARRWMRFFALRGESGLVPLQAAWGELLWDNLERLFAAKEPQEILNALPPFTAPGDEPEDGSGGAFAWLFPKGRVFLYLPQAFLEIAEYWIPMGTDRKARKKTPTLHIDIFERDRFHYDPSRQEVVLPQKLLDKGYKDFGGVFVTSARPLPRPYPIDGPFVVTSMPSPYLYVVDDAALKSLAFRLLAPAYPLGDPSLSAAGFRQIAFDPAAGGVWELLP